jgi:hypothetical protein
MRVGVDGWVRDIVIDLPPSTDQQTEALVIAIHRLMFGTAYKAYSIPIEVDRAQATNVDLNLHVTSAQLYRWLIGATREKHSTFSWGLCVFLVGVGIIYLWIAKKLFSGRRFLALILVTIVFGVVGIVLFPHRGQESDSQVLRLKPVLGGSETTLQTLLDREMHGVYATVQPGLVVWCVGKEGGIEKAAIESREFALDSDLLLGAIALGKDVAIVGRARTTPITLLPPLRTETILQLASANTKELAQSYERKFLFAGKTDMVSAASTRIDWAPIYLSDELVDTEYGSLLNITDQMLKSWSMHALIKYANFPYPDPATYPFAKTLMDEAKTNEVTFNWNTRGAGYVSRYADYEVFSLNRLGSLPIDYLALDNSNLLRAEDRAYQYYSGLSDPNLVRVVQYAGLYQIFAHFGITAPSNTPVHHGVSALEDKTDRLVKGFAAVKDSSDLFDPSDDVGKELRDTHDLLKKFISLASPEENRQLISCLADPAVAQIDLSSNDDTRKELAGVCLQVSSALRGVLSKDIRSEAESLYEHDANNRTVTGWIHTPSVVLSTAVGSEAGATGGHNLSAAITDFHVDSGLAPGEVRVVSENGREVVYHSAADADKMPEIARVAGRDSTKEAAVLKTEIEASLKQQVDDGRTLMQALYPGDAPTTGGIPGFGRSQIPTGGRASGWWTTTEASTPENDRLVAAFARRDSKQVRPALIVSRGTSHAYDITGPAGMHIQADNLPAAVEAVRAISHDTFAADGIRLHFRGIDETEGNGFVRSTRAHMGGSEKVDATFEGSMTADDIRAVAADYDLSKVTVREVSSPKMIDEHAVVDAHLEIAPKSWFGKPLLIRIRLYFSDMASATLAFTERISFAFRDFTDTVDTFMAFSQLKRDLQVAHPGLKGIDMQLIDSQRKDLYVAEDAESASRQQQAGKAA